MNVTIVCHDTPAKLRMDSKLQPTGWVTEIQLLVPIQVLTDDEI